MCQTVLSHQKYLVYKNVKIQNKTSQIFPDTFNPLTPKI